MIVITSTSPDDVTNCVGFFHRLSVRDQSAFLDAALTIDQLEGALLSRRARRDHSGPTFAQEMTSLRQRADCETRATFRSLHSVRERALRIVEDTTSLGIDSDLVGSHLVRTLVASGVDVAEAETLAAELTSWRARTDVERWTAVAKAMLGDGFTPDEVRVAIELALTSEGVAA